MFINNCLFCGCNFVPVHNVHYYCTLICFEAHMNAFLSEHEEFQMRAHKPDSEKTSVRVRDTSRTSADGYAVRSCVIIKSSTLND